MTHMLKIAKAASAALVLGTLVIGAVPAGAASAETPFAATFTGHVAFTNETMTAAAWSGTGVARQLGASTGAGVMVVTGPSDSCPGGIANTHTATFTAANGDTLTLKNIDVACPVGPGQVHGTGHWTVTGGTGRFAGVTGSGSIDGDVNFATGEFRASWTGSLTR